MLKKKLNFCLSINIKKHQPFKLKNTLQLGSLKEDIFLLSSLIGSSVIRIFIKSRHLNSQIEKHDLLLILEFFKKLSKIKINYLNEIATYDVPTSKARFTLNYILSSLTNGALLVLNVKIGELDLVDSLVPLFKAAG